MSSPSSLRERSKAKRRAAIQRAAFRLFAEHGYDGATIAEIAEAAEVAPRSVSMYFPSKLDIAMSTSSDIVDRLMAIFEAHPELDALDVVDRWLLGEHDAQDPELVALTRSMFEANPDLQSVSRGRFAGRTSALGEALQAQVGLTTDDPMFGVVHAAITAAVTAYLGSIHDSGADPGTHRAFMRYLRTIVRPAAR